MEFFDVLDCRGRKTGERIARDDAHRTGVRHGAFHCLIIYERDGRGHALFQRRSSCKKIAPGRFDVSVGGHYSAGEDARSAGPREIREELGLDVKFEALLPLGRRVFVYCFSPGVEEYEFQDVYLLFRAIAPQELSLQAEEVDGVIEMELEAGIDLFTGAVPSIECGFYRTGSSGSRVVVTPEEFVSCLDNYYLKLLILAKRYLRGERKGLVI